MLQRNAHWDNIKLVLITLVVIGHTLQAFAKSDSATSILLFIYSFHMPAFIFVSGLFSKRTVKEKNISKVLPYVFIWLFIRFLQLLQSVLQGNGNYSISLLNETRYGWYIIAVFFMFLLAMAFSKFKPSYALVFAVFASIMLGYSDLLFKDYQLFGRVVVFFPFFLLGYYADIKKLEDVLKKPAIKIAGAVLLCGAILLFAFKGSSLEWLIDVFKGKDGYSTFKYGEKFGLLIRIAWYFASALLSLSLFAVIPSKKNPLTFIGSRTLQIYVLHYPLGVIIMQVLGLQDFLKTHFSSGLTVIYVVFAIFMTAILSLKYITSFFNQFLNYSVKKDEVK